jgi:hypothetical protein
MILKFLDNFIFETKQEYEKQSGKLSSRMVGLSRLAFEQGAFDKGDYILYMNTMPTVAVPILKGKVIKSMEENLKGFLTSFGCKVDSVKYAGD